MKYFRVKPEYAGKYKNPYVHNADIYVSNELYTLKEVEKQNLNKNFLKEVNISKKSVYWFFGARFSTITGGYDNYKTV